MKNLCLQLLVVPLLMTHVSAIAAVSQETASLKPVQLTSLLSVNNQKPLTHYLPNVYTISLGAGWPINDQNNQTLFLESDLKKTYTAGQYHRVPAQGELFAGWQKNLPRQLIGQVGVAVGASTNVSIIGDIWEDADPTFNNFSYGHLLSHQQVMVEGVLLAPYGRIITPYVRAGIGAGFNEVHSFTITPIIAEEVAAPAFKSNMTSAFTYMVGVGLQKALNTHWQGSVGYAFSDWGKSQFNKATGETLNNSPSMQHYYVNSLVFQMSYLR